MVTKHLLIAFAAVMLSTAAPTTAAAAPRAASQVELRARLRTSPRLATGAEVRAYAHRQARTPRGMAKFEGGHGYYYAHYVWVPITVVLLTLLLVVVLIA